MAYLLFTHPASAVSISLKHALLATFYATNWARAFGADEPNLFAHTWSLSIEEQFYLVWPLCLIWILRKSSTRESAANVLLMVTLSFVIYRILLFTGGADLPRVLNGADTRADALLAGVLGLACCTRQNRPQLEGSGSFYLFWQS